MARSAFLTAGVDMTRALHALKLRGSDQIVTTANGVEIRSRGRPTLLLTLAAAEEFAHQIQEAEHG